MSPDAEHDPRRPAGPFGPAPGPGDPAPAARAEPSAPPPEPHGVSGAMKWVLDPKVARVLDYDELWRACGCVRAALDLAGDLRVLVLAALRVQKAPHFGFEVRAGTAVGAGPADPSDLRAIQVRKPPHANVLFEADRTHDSEVWVVRRCVPGDWPAGLARRVEIAKRATDEAFASRIAKEKHDALAAFGLADPKSPPARPDDAELRRIAIAELIEAAPGGPDAPHGRERRIVGPASAAGGPPDDL